ncbi:MAG: T9SS type A sorting domain-containing protein [Gemmatimonadetes bacterium]|nr:T9SS type A sorting domain-containing protein [Gemmatimonadota bacterium]
MAHVSSNSHTRTFAAFLILMLAAAVAAPSAWADRNPEAAARAKSRFNLSAGATLVLDVNLVQCGITNEGEVCVNVFNSPTGGGGFWPKGTANQYVFNSGLQIAGRVPRDAGFAWAGDTVAAFFFDARGDQLHGDFITNIFNSLDAADVAAWPEEAKVNDPEIFNEALLGRVAASQQDSWVAYWDANPNKLGGGRKHPMGIKVEQRSLAWNFPAGNQDIIYFLIKFTNVTNDPEFQRLQENAFFGGANALPDGGWRMDSVYASFSFDPDVGNFATNYSYAILPFDLGLTYGATFEESGWVFPPDIYFPPFANGVGIFASKYLKSPRDLGLTLFTATLNAATGFPDPIGPAQLWRYLSGRVSTALGDNPCNVTLQTQGRVCFLEQVQRDTRFDEVSGPFSLGPGESTTIGVAFVHAAPLDVPEFILGGDVKPGIPSTPEQLAADPTRINPIDKIAGWRSASDLNGDGRIDQTEVEIAHPATLLGKALVAQAVFDNKFLLPFAPELPDFFLIPGDRKVTVVWKPSATETDGDPFFAVASDPESPLFDPNFRKLDVEGYRIYKATREQDIQLLAQFDFAGTFMVDEAGGRFASNDLGELSEAGDAIPLGAAGGSFQPFDFSRVIQVPEGGAVELADGRTLVVKADTAVTGGGSGFAPLTDTGVPFGFSDTDVVNGFDYFYAVTAFDVNSLKSGPTSLESARRAKRVVPRVASRGLVPATFREAFMGEQDTLNPSAALPEINAETGIFSGPMPPTNAAEAFFRPLVPEVLSEGTTELKIDSVRVGSEIGLCEGAFNALGGCGVVFVSVTNPDGSVQQLQRIITIPVWDAFGEPSEVFDEFARLVPFDEEGLARFGIPPVNTNAIMNLGFRQSIDLSAHENQAARRNRFGAGGGFSPGGPRWFNGTQESEPDPGRGIRVGHLAELDSVWSPRSHSDSTPEVAGSQTPPNSGSMQCFNYIAAIMGRAADVRVTWQGGTFGEIRDVTHDVPVPFSENAGASYGFIDDANGNGTIDWKDFNYLDQISQTVDDNFLGFCAHTDPGPAGRARLRPNPVVKPIHIGSGKAGDLGTPNGTGFGLYINGERYIFKLTGGQLPPDGTVWTLRNYSGRVRASTDATGLDPSGYTFSPALRPATVPGTRFRLTVDQATRIEPVAQKDLERIHTWPDPYYVTSPFDLAPVEKRLKFVNLPDRAIIRIYSLSGLLVAIINHNDPSGGAMAEWNLRNRNNQFVASGVYFYHVETEDGKEIIKKFTVVNFAR